jgi:hypothetical protein
VQDICHVRRIKLERVTEPGARSLNAASHIFSREIEEWHRLPPHTRATPDHYKPKGSRSTWSHCQYTVYKEEQEYWRDMRTRETWTLNRKAAKVAGDLRKRCGHGTVKVGHLNRHILDIVPARRHGQPPVQKNMCGRLEKPAKVTTETSLAAKVDREKQALKGSEDDHQQNATRDRSDHVKFEIDAEVIPSSDPPSQASVAVSSEMPVVDRENGGEDHTKGIADNDENEGEVAGTLSDVDNCWIVPESEDDYESEVEVEYDVYGNKVVHDYWPSGWRNAAAQKVNDVRMTKTVSATAWATRN